MTMIKMRQALSIVSVRVERNPAKLFTILSKIIVWYSKLISY